jgi:glycosyltransferase involved in cell wall biosynthesis
VPFHNIGYKLFDRLIFSWLTPLVWKSAKKIIANSEGLKNEALKIKDNLRISVVTNGVDTEFFVPSAENKEADGPMKITYTGRLNRVKGLDVLVASAVHVRGSFEVNIVGDGPACEALKKKALEFGQSGRINFVGQKDREEILKIYQDSDIFVMPSLNEGMSNSVLEAMACGLPVIVTDTSGSSEMICGNGYIVPRADKIALAVTMQKFIDDPNLKESMGLVSRTIALKMSWKSTARRHLDEYISCVQ